VVFLSALLCLNGRCLKKQLPRLWEPQKPQGEWEDVVYEVQGERDDVKGLTKPEFEVGEIDRVDKNQMHDDDDCKARNKTHHITPYTVKKAGGGEHQSDIGNYSSEVKHKERHPPLLHAEEIEQGVADTVQDPEVLVAEHLHPGKTEGRAE